MIRCWDPRDAPLLKDAVDSSLEHLRPWMPWVHDEPQSLEQKVHLLRRFRGQFDLEQDYVYGIFDAAESQVVGGTGLHTRVGADALEIGYWIRRSEVGRGLATEAVSALTRVAFEHCEVDRVEIRVDPANDASAKIPRKLGFVEEATLRRRLLGGPDADRRDAVVFAIFADAFGSSPAATTMITAFDASGARV